MRSGLLAYLIQLDLGTVRIGDVNRQSIGTIVQILEKLDLVGLELIAQTAHVVYLEGDMIDLSLSGLTALYEGNALAKRGEGTAILQGLRRPDSEPKLFHVEFGRALHIVDHDKHVPVAEN